jgi:membrane associated rhomboid family serine protease
MADLKNMIPFRDNIPSRSFPVITVGLILINVAVFFYELALGRELGAFFERWGVIPALVFAWPETELPFQAIALPFFTSMFLHGGWMHLIFNMWILWIYGDNVEDILGHGRYLLFYLACGAAAAMTQYISNPLSRVPLVGASGAIAGVMGAYLVKFPHARILTLVPIFIFFTTFEVPAALVLLYWFVLQVFSGVGSIGYSQLSQGGVAWFAHVGGFVAGMVLVLVLRTRQRYRHRRDVYW